ncbi:ROK family protein [Alkalibacter rhizosphaerae]|uniref:ROK family protein n=1 Tax=Alkalibacter rhizosphaerae TaxID=2815577 RepID=A0A974XG97_9FIRM|nr:ROK family protein [Alkalibacter rhizosphaerae]QSX09327.1 ROK family protein [Alkalibacter rhizosphaerae]
MEVAARKFLKQHGMSWESLDLIQESRIFCEEMERGISGRSSSLKMLASYIDPSLEVERDREVVVVDAGGTNFRIGLLRFGEDGPKLYDVQTHPMPGTEEELDAEAFFQALADLIQPTMDQEKADRLGFCFSYPTRITPTRDGRLITFTKELQVRDVEGRLIGEELGKRLRRPVAITVLNDATAALLGLVAVGHRDQRLHSIAMILGTGMNTSYVEYNASIDKEPSLQNKLGSNVVNLESGGYGRIPQGTADRLLDQKTTNPGEQKMEKMMSGAYLGDLFLETILLAVEDGYLPGKPFVQFQKAGFFPTKDLTGFAQGMPSHINVMAEAAEKLSPDQQEFLHALAKGLLRRAAKLAAINLVGISLKMQKSDPVIRRLHLIMEGSTFYGSVHIQHYLDAYLKHAQLNTGIQIERIKLENAALLGAGLAAFARENDHE